MYRIHTILLILSAIMISASCSEKKITAEGNSGHNTTTTTAVDNEKTKVAVRTENGVPEKIWMTIGEAIKAQATNPKPIVIDVYTKWCGPCKMLDQNTFNDPRVKKYLYENYYPVKFDAESPDTVVFAGNTFTNPDYVPNQPGRNGVHQFAMYLNVGAYPTLFFLDKTAQPLGPLTGYRTPAQIEIFLKYFAEEKYKTITTQEQFQEHEKNFVVTWN